jgi:Cell cycle control protein
MASKSDPNYNPTKDQTTTMTTTTTTTATREPLDTAARQQRMKAWTPILHPLWVIATLILIGVTFIPIGIKIKAVGDEVVEYKIQYDSYRNRNSTKDEVVRQACGIETANEGKSCLVEYVITQDMKGPIMVYYEIDNFYQNHREYYTSRDDAQVSTEITFHFIFFEMMWGDCCLCLQLYVCVSA